LRASDADDAEAVTALGFSARSALLEFFFWGLGVAPLSVSLVVWPARPTARLKRWELPRRISNLEQGWRFVSKTRLKTMLVQISDSNSCMLSELGRRDKNHR